MSLASQFRAHLEHLDGVIGRALAETGYDALVVSSGTPFTYFADDQDAPFQTSPAFAWLCPARGPHHLLVVRQGRRPRLIRHAPPDYWYEQAPLADGFWLDAFDVEQAETPDAAWEAVGGVGKAAYVGDAPARATAHGAHANPRPLVARLDWARSYKTDYEVGRIAEANALAARGHVAAREAFVAGSSELEIHHAYVEALGVTDAGLPYGTIVALDEKGATLHYENKRAVRDGRVLLIDAGARSEGYASDVTRTHVSPRCDPRFAELRRGMESLQQALCGSVRPGGPFLDLQLDAHRRVAGLLREQGISRVSDDEAISLGVTRAFFPHGLGHFLGIQVHDVAGHQADPEGNPAPPPPDHPFLRNTRRIEPGQVFTMEPGVYFIPMLLAPLREGAAAGAVDWTLVDELTPCGGIRIEDNLLVTADGHRNLTREHLPD